MFFQVTQSTDTKPKPSLTKPGWPASTKPPTGTQSAWGAPTNSVASIVSHSTMSPRASRPQSSASLQKSQSAVLKQPSDVSRQLFPDKVSSVGPIASHAINPRHQQGMVSKSPPAYPATQTTPPVSMMYPAASQHPSVSQAVVRPQVPPMAVQNQSVMQRPSASYSPFNGQIDPQGALLQQQHYSFNRSDQMKAPGYKPNISPRSSPYTQEEILGFNRAPGPRPSSTIDPMMSPLSSLSVSTSLPNAYNAGPPHTSPRATDQLGTSGMEGQSLSEQQRYSTASQPMTLPRIASSLNPNASEFTASNRFMVAENPAQQSPRSSSNKQQTSPVEPRPSPPVAAFQPQARLPGTQQTQLPDQVDT